jgi:type I restriction-modification system DNA methylase subunit
MPPMNERKTEALVELRLRKHGYERNNSGITIEKQKSDTPRIQKLLENASKRGGGVGKPEFLIHSKDHSEFLIVVECKADHRKHASTTLDKYADYAVDGALLYAAFLSKQFDVLAIAVSGQNESTYRISHFLHLQGTKKAVEFEGAHDIVPLEEYYQTFINSDVKFRQDYDELLGYSRELNEELQAKKIKEAHRGLLICGVLVALENAAFKKGFRVQRTARTLANNLVQAIVDEFRNANLPAARILNLEQAFSFIRTSATLTSDKEFFVRLIEEIDSNVNSFVRTHKYHDALGQFYVQFLRYANNDKGLGIVLTPPHIAELFADLAEVNKDSIVYDNCCGTAGLLIAAMKKMLTDNGVNAATEKTIKNRRLLGIEFQDDIYALAVSNMVVHGDGKTNILPGDCFELSQTIKKKFKPTVGVLNPPYKTKASTIEELDFVLNNLSALQPGGKCVAILPFGCAIGDSGEIVERKRRLLEGHTLEAVMSMPIELFHDSNVGVVTCVMVITAHRPHPKGKKTWFGYWRDDGFVKTKHLGRIDANRTWHDTKAKWLNAFRGRDVIKNFSLLAEVQSKDEWCAEAYMETDYSLLTQEDFDEEIKKYIVFRILNEGDIEEEDDGAA